MTIFPLSYPKGRMIRTPTRAELRAMFERPDVMKLAIVCATVVFLALLGVSAWIIVSGHDLYVFTAAMLTPVLTFLGLILRRQKALEKRMDEALSSTATGPTP